MFHQKNYLVLLKTNNLEANNRRFDIPKKLTANKSPYSFVINHLFCYDAVCFCSCFWVRAMFEYAMTYKVRASKLSRSSKSHVPYWFTWKGLKTKKINLLRLTQYETKRLFCPRLTLTSSESLMMVSLEKKLLLSDFARQLMGRSADVPDAYLTLFSRRCW